MQNWLFSISILAVAFAAADFIRNRKRWIGPYGLVFEAKASLKSLVAAAFFMALSTSAVYNLLRVPVQARYWTTTALLLVSLYFSILSVLRGRRRRVPAWEIALWCRELGLLLQQEMPILQALKVVAEDCRSYRLFEFTVALQEAVRSGDAVSDWCCMPPLSGYPEELIKAGEESGDLGSALVGLAEIFERYSRHWKTERRAKQPEQPKQEPTEQELTTIYLALPGRAKEAEKLLITRMHGLEVTEHIYQSPVVRAVNIVIGHAIQEGASHVYFVSNGILSIEFANNEDERREVLTLSPLVKEHFLRRLKLLADIPYWRQPPATGFISVKYHDVPYRLLLWAEPEEDGHEILRLDIMPSGFPAEPEE